MKIADCNLYIYLREICLKRVFKKNKIKKRHKLCLKFNRVIRMNILKYIKQHSTNENRHSNKEISDFKIHILEYIYKTIVLYMKDLLAQ